MGSVYFSVRSGDDPIYRAPDSYITHQRIDAHMKWLPHYNEYSLGASKLRVLSLPLWPVVGSCVVLACRPRRQRAAAQRACKGGGSELAGLAEVEETK